MGRNWHWPKLLWAEMSSDQWDYRNTKAYCAGQNKCLYWLSSKWKVKGDNIWPQKGRQTVWRRKPLSQMKWKSIALKSLLIFNESFSRGNVPDDWRRTNDPSIFGYVGCCKVLISLTDTRSIAGVIRVILTSLTKLRQIHFNNFIIEKKKVKIRNWYNQVPHLARNIIWNSDKNTRNHHTQDREEASLSPTGDHKTARNRQGSIANGPPHR